MVADQGLIEAHAQAGHNMDLSWMPAWRIAGLIAAKEISPVEVIDHFLARVERLDPVYHAFRMIDPEGARRQAQEAEKVMMSGAALGPLHGIPIALKEHIPARGLLWHDLKVNAASISDRDGIEAERLRQAGAVLVGTTVAGLTAVEFGNSNSQPLNVWNPDRICGDSSSGSAGATASAMMPVTLAVDGLGSTRLPAAYSGLVGICPTAGRVPNISWTNLIPQLLSRTGPLARDVRDAAIVLSVLAGPDGRDFTCLDSPAPDYLSGLDDGVKGLRLLWTDDFGFGAAYATSETKEVIARVRQAAQMLADAGATIAPLGGVLQDPTPACNTVLVSDPSVFIYADMPAPLIAHAREMRAQVLRSMQKLMAGADFIICPTAQQIAPTLQQWSDYWQPSEDGQPSPYMSTYSALTGFINLIGWPAMSVPAGLVRGAPVGLQIIGRPDSEPAMLRVAQEFFQRYQIDKPKLA